MIKRLTTYIAVAASLVLGACSEETLRPDVPDAGGEEGVRVSIAIPDMPRLATRAFGDTPAADLKLTVFEFEKGSDPTNTFLTKIYQAETLTQTNVANGATVDFRINDLLMTESPRVLHFVVAPQHLDAKYASEAVVFSNLSVRDNSQAYWGRVEFPNGYGTVDKNMKPQLTDEAKQKLTGVNVLRNFAKVSVEVAATATANFQLTGFELVNVPTSGTVAPYNSGRQEFPQMFDDAGTMLGYLAVAGNGSGQQGYSGIMPANCGFRNLEENFSPVADGGRPAWSTRDAYLYEHPFESTRRTYVILQGNYRPTTTDAWQTCYYKIDLVRLNEESGMTEYYDILRNYDFHINVTGVSAPGASTASEAISGVSYNNISADVDARDMLQISDGANIVEVSKTNIIFTNTTPVEFLYRYSPVGGFSSETTNAKLHTNGLNAGDVIASVTAPEVYTDADGVVWVKRVITPKPIPEAGTREQSFYVVDADGLGREIRLVAHVPYDYSDIEVYPGSENGRPTSAAGQGTVSPLSGQPFTVYFNLPAGMPEAMFPLTFILESNRQNMENNPIGTLVVTSGQTGFPTTEVYEVPRIKYRKTVSYAEYLYKTDANNNLITDGAGNYVENTDHTVRCRFRTINSLAELPGAPTQTVTYLLISNDYFNCTGENTQAAVPTWPGVATFTRTR
ncbi:hypothetical protein [Barnesiella sp. CU968]|uniref:hypothetical protein n=1 Tax=Barnesiella sp. CU968 TaxID=2780099 RepID=UPI00195B83AC|nr:hypothetical protein [Barnesiella sp. CU968]MBJ2198809.1 hypothetical protein [Muribaculaceae bacterium]MCI9030026.1 hypothetical protein [Muribaculaceae bacterium]